MINKNFIVSKRQFLAIKWNIKTSVAGLNFTNSLRAIVKNTTYVKRFSFRGLSPYNGTLRNDSIAREFPRKFSLTKYLEDKKLFHCNKMTSLILLSSRIIAILLSMLNLIKKKIKIDRYEIT